MPNERRYSNELNLESVGINLPYNMQACLLYTSDAADEL